MPKQLSGCLLTLVACALLLLLTPPAVGAPRVALVVGNGEYESVQRLANPANDARDIAQALGGLGFDVDLQLDLDRVGMWRAVKSLARRAKGAEAALFFYAGHGVQKDRVAYLVPTDGVLESEVDLPAFSIELTHILAPLQDPTRPTLVFLDACRNDPFAESEDATRGPIASTGLGTPSAQGGMLIAYATGAGDTAADGRQRNSPFTRALLAHLDTPGLEIKSLLTRVRQALVAGGGRQLSETSDRLYGDFYFKPPPAAEPARLVEAGPERAGEPVANLLAERADYVFWKAIDGSSKVSDFELFLQQHPTSPLAPLAQSRLGSLRQQAEAAAPKLATRPGPKPAAAPPPAHIPPPQEEKQLAALPTPERRAAPQPPPDALIRYIGGQGVSLRDARHAKASRIEFLTRGTEVKAGAARDGWAEVWTARGRHGFVAERLLAASPDQLDGRSAAQRAKARLPGEIFRDCEGCPELVAVPTRPFVMGSPPDEPGRDDDEGPRGEVRLGKPLAVGRFELTFAEWDACVAAGGCGGYRPEEEGWGRDRRPVINVSHADALAYLAWLGAKTGKRYRLLSEAEWEFAARAGERGPNPWGEDDSSACRDANLHDEASRRLNAYGWTWARCSDGQARTAPVGTYGSNELGLADMLGNVAEWTADCWHEDMTMLPGDGAPATTGDCSQRVLRGGDWRAHLDAIRYAARASAPAVSRTATDGFRVARDLDEGLRENPPGPVAVGG